MAEMSAYAIAKKLKELDLWSQASSYNFAVKLKNLVFPYFCVFLTKDQREEGTAVRLLMLEGWQTLHDFIRTQLDANFGVYTAIDEFPHYELVLMKSGELTLKRHDTGYQPQDLTPAQEKIVAKILWEVYGILFRLESEPQLPLKYLGEQAIFGRVEKRDGSWEDAPLPITPPLAYVEKVSFEKDDLKAAKDLEFVRGGVINVDFRLLSGRFTDEARPRAIYNLVVYDPLKKKRLFDATTRLEKDSGLKEMWEAMPRIFLKFLIKFGMVPGEVRVAGGRMFRFLRPLCLDLPFKLTIDERLELGE